MSIRRKSAMSSPVLITLLKGFVLGLSIAAPVGPIGVLCIRRTLVAGKLTGLVSGLGAATADGIYGCIAGFGLTVVADFLVDYSPWLRIVGGLFLCYLGITTLRTEPVALEKNCPHPQRMTEGIPAVNSVGRAPFLFGAYTSTLALTLTNPATVFSFMAIFAGLGIVESGRDYATSSVLVGGVFVGSASWWLFLSSTVNLLRSRFTAARMRWLNRISGMILISFGVVALAVQSWQ